MLYVQQMPFAHNWEPTLSVLALSYADNNHRIANSLQFLAATLRMQLREIEDSNARGVLLDAERRIAAVGCLHRLLQPHQPSGQIMLDDLLHEMVKALEVAWLEPSSMLTISIRCAPVRLPVAKAIPLAMIASELICNSLKYAYASVSGGEIRVQVELNGTDLLVLNVEDDGAGFNNSPIPSDSGSGRKIVDALASQISASIERPPVTFGARTIVRVDIRS
jgi:two-component sensor histidine kinase